MAARSKFLYPFWAILILIVAFLLLFGRILWVHWHGEYVTGSASFWDSLTADVFFETMVVFVVGLAIAIVWVVLKNGPSSK